jgi:uncharacterized membrane protein YhiD involved in acid resistance
MVQLQAAPGKPEDVSRVIQGIITGIGFLGAGAACGAGHFTLTLGALLATLLVLLAGGPFERAVQRLSGDKPGPGRDN